MEVKPVDDFEYIYVYELLKKRRELMEVILLPSGYLVMLDSDIIMAIFNDKHQNILP